MLSEVFHVTDAAGNVTREGRVTSSGSGCPTLLGADDVPYALAGDLSGFDLEGTVIVEGAILESSSCGEQTTIRVIGVTAPESSGR